MNKPLTLTIGIIAHNEEKTIRTLLMDVGRQIIQEQITLLDIFVISDGSTDQTIKEASFVKNPKIHLIAHNEQHGKNIRLNELFDTSQSDITILLDADIRLANLYVFKNLLQPMIDENNIGLICGNPLPLPSKSLAGRAANNWIMTLVDLRNSLNNGDSPYSACGPIMAVTHTFQTLFHIPKDVPDDRYLYFMCKKLGFDFRYIPSAVVWYKAAQTTHDLLSQGKRYHNQFQNLVNHVGVHWVNREFFITKHTKIGMALRQLTKDPIAYIFMKLIHMKMLLSKHHETITWQPASSSKNLTTSS